MSGVRFSSAQFVSAVVKRSHADHTRQIGVRTSARGWRRSCKSLGTTHVDLQTPRSRLASSLSGWERFIIDKLASVSDN